MTFLFLGLCFFTCYWIFYWLHPFFYLAEISNPSIVFRFGGLIIGMTCIAFIIWLFSTVVWRCSL